ncbi:hypothetical protein MPER_06518 [Moniliophthora perniciosa FA553]|nr:hypothetical protein MPER_06518 [Moniliophthora perniciosa FA553]
MPITPCIARFLERHQQTLKSVTLVPVGIQNNPTFQPITYHFPCLDSFIGNAALAVSFFQSVPDALPEMEYMMVNWGFFEDFDFRELIKAMEKRCPKQQPIDLSFNRMGWNEDLIEEISQRFPQVQELTIDCSEMDDEDELQQETLEAVAQSLKKCKALTDFSWTVVREDPETFEDRSVENWNIEKHMSNVMLLSDACPSLDYCRAPNGVTWVRYICGYLVPFTPSQGSHKRVSIDDGPG